MGGARVTTLVTLRKCTLGHKREIKTFKFVSASTKGFKGGLAWIKPSKKDMAVTFSYLGTNVHNTHVIYGPLVHESGVHEVAEHGARRAENMEIAQNGRKCAHSWLGQMRHMPDLDRSVP